MLMMTMKVNGLLRKGQLLSKTGTAYDEYDGKWAPQEKCHAPVARSRGTLPWHAPVARSRGTLPPRARLQEPHVTKPENLVENTFTKGLRLKT